MNNRLSAALFAALGGALCLLAGCSTRTDVSATGNTPVSPQYSHVWITVQDVWFNTSSTAGVEDGGWTKFSLSKPNTVDLVAVNGGNLGTLATALRIAPSTYSQILLVPLDASAPLAASAQNAGAIYNAEADYVDSAGTTHQLPLELLSPATGIGIPTSLKVPVGNIGKSLAATTLGSTTGTTSGTTGLFGTTSGTGLGTGTTSSTSTTPTNSFVVTFDGTKDLVPFNYATNIPGILLSSHATAYDLSVSGAISGQLTISNITTGSSGLPAIQVSAETLSADGTRHVVVSSTTVQADGNFLLYPLATNTSTTYPQTYDVVIHGPGIATMIIRSVQVPRPTSTSTSLTSTLTSTPTSTTPSSTTPSSMTNPSSTTPSNTNTSATSTTPAVTAVSLGTLTPRSAAPSGSVGSYTATISTAAGSPLPAGARVEFYQTLARQGEVPYVIETSAIDPFNQVLFNPQTLSTGTVDSGTWSTSGGAITLVSAAPAEGAGTYDVAGVAPSFNDGPLTQQVKAPASGSGPVPVVVPALALASGISAGSITATVTPVTPGKYDKGELLLSSNGTLVATQSLDTALGQGGTVTVTSVPSGTPSSLYYATVRAWNSGDPQAVQSQSSPTAIDLRSSTSGAIALTVN
jgi:hypothetical protein